MNVEHKHIIVDSTKMQEILSNLISNAIKYTSAGGKVTIDTKELPYDKEGYVLIQTKVSDTGIGMSEEFLPSLFELFTREIQLYLKFQVLDLVWLLSKILYT